VTQLQLTSAQFLSGLFFSQLARLEGLQFNFDAQRSLVTNLSLSSFEDVKCQCQDVNWHVAETKGCENLVVYAQALDLEKLWQLQQELDAEVVFWQLKTLPGVGTAATAQIRSHNSDELTGKLEVLSQALYLELAILNKRPVLEQPGLIVMDMDSTVIQMECIDEIAKLAGVGEQVSEVTELAMQGKLDFTQSLNSRVACLAGLEESLLANIRNTLPLMPGIETLLSCLRANGWKLAIASGGFTYFADHLMVRLDLDAAVSNQLQIEQGKLTGKVQGQIVDAKVKAQTLKQLAEEYGIPIKQTIALGDGANDLVMMQAAGLGVAYHAKPLVREQAQAAIRFHGLDTLLHYLE